MYEKHVKFPAIGFSIMKGNHVVFIRLEIITPSVQQEQLLIIIPMIGRNTMLKSEKNLVSNGVQKKKTNKFSIILYLC